MKGFFNFLFDNDEKVASSYKRGEEQNREEGEMAQIKLGGRNWLRK